MKKILFTGFEPFDGAATNPSWDAVSLLPEEIDGCRISRILLPVEYDSVGSLLDAAIAKEQPDAVICVGQAGGRSAITPEMVAINLKDASIPDNAGISYDGVPILEGAPAAYFATIPVKSIAAAIREAGIPASVSYTAGTYVCNSLMYHLMHLLAQKYPSVIGGFIHIPFDCTQVAASGKTSYPSLPLSTSADGLKAAALAVGKALDEGSQDIREASGYTH